MRCLIVDDDRALCELLTMSLLRAGMVVDVAHSGEAGMGKILDEEYDIILLGVMLPDYDGFTVLDKVRRFSSVPVIMITAKGEEQDTVLGLEAGADDYIAKPLRGQELVARMRSLLRRAGLERDASPVQYGDIVLHNSGVDQVSVAGVDVKLTNVEASILRVLCEHAHHPVSRDLLYQLVLRRENSPYDRSIDTHVSNLRKKLGARENGVDRIAAVRGVGYKYCL
ncbi:response regulator transcription factor [Pseudomonadales bacterium]|nr:response regulator transcription factor [Pseudomonadales bacterium]